MKKKITDKERREYKRIIEEATVDSKDEDEQISGWACTFEDAIQTPCKCFIGKQEAVLEEIEPSDSNEILGIVKINKAKIRTPIQDIVLENSKLMKYILAYKYWISQGY